MKISICKGCGGKIIWAVNKETGKKIPLDPKPTVYAIDFTEGDHVSVIREPYAYVSHFVTCPDANRFSASKKPPQGDLFNET